jgi:plasmid stabilization system protein ParE
VIRYKINIAPEAAKEIEDIYLYIADDSPNNAAKWYFAIHDKIHALKDFPDSCPIAYEDRFYDFQIRNLIFGNYRVIYRIQEDIIQILHVKHTAQQRNPF